MLFTGRYPAGLYDFVLGYLRWGWRSGAWYSGLTDRYPPFSGAPDDDYPATVDCPMPESSSRLLAVLRILGITVILVIPHLIVLWVLFIISSILTWLAQWGILFTGSFPGGFVNLIVGFQRWQYRANCYMYGLTDGYPPFGMDD